METVTDTGGDTGCGEEVPYDGIDQDCDGGDLRDVDGDGAEAQRVGGADCDDADAAVGPGAEETCGNLRDDDCDARTDEGCVADGPPDPGGLSWICGPVAGGPLGVALLVAAGLAWARRGR